MSSRIIALQFGIEMEFLLRPKPVLKDVLEVYHFNHKVTTESQNETAKQANRDSLREALTAEMGIAGIEASTSPSGYLSWTIADESSLDEQPGFWRCELVSKIFSTLGDWQNEVELVFSVLLRSCDILLTAGCSMHVHVSPEPSGRFSTLQIQQVIKQVIYYDNPLTRIMPPDRKNNVWAVSNVQKSAIWRNGHTQVPQMTWAPLFDPIDKCKMMQHLLFGWSQDRYVSWNFSNVLSECGTVEFRRPPGVKRPSNAIHWAAFALGFVAHAMEIQNWSMLKLTYTYPTTQDLRAAITSGAQILGQTLNGALGPMPDDNRPAHPLNPLELSKINEKKKDKSLKPSPFAEKVIRSRPNTPTGASRPHTPNGGSQPHTPTGGSRPHTPNGGSRSHTPTAGSRSHTPTETSQSHTLTGALRTPTPTEKSQPYTPARHKRQ